MKKVLFVLALVAVASVATAQSAGKYGFNVAYGGGGSNIAVTYHLSDMLALRPGLGYTSNDNGTTVSTRFTVGSDVLYYLSNADGMGMYVGGGFSYVAKSTDKPETSDSEMDFKGLLGFQYALNAKLGVYGEVAFSYTSLSGDGGDSSSLGTKNSGVGLIFYLN